MQLRYNQFVRKLHISRQELKPIKQSEKNDPKWIKYTKTAKACRVPDFSRERGKRVQYGQTGNEY